MAVNKRLWIWAVMILALSACIAYTVQAAERPAGGRVIISSGGEVIRVIDLSESEDCEFDIAYEGRVNRVRIENRTVCVCEADCPDRICVKTGKLSVGRPVVCLPNKLIIEYEKGENGYDAGTR